MIRAAFTSSVRDQGYVMAWLPWDGWATVADIAKPANLAAPVVDAALIELRRAGMVESENDAGIRWRKRQVRRD